MSAGSPGLQLGISWILRIGVILSLVLESAGLILNYLYTGDSSLNLSPKWLAGGENFFGFASSTLGSFFSGANPVSIVALGVAVLVFTPYARVIAAVFYYAVEKDWKYVGITLLVLAVITYGLLFF